MASDNKVITWPVLRSGGEPPDNDGMDARVAKLEALVTTLATKEDVVKLRGETREGFADVRSSVEAVRTEMHKGTAEIIKWVIGTAVVISVGAITIMTFVLNNAAPKSPAPQSTAPIIITVPSPQAAPAPAK